MPVDVKIGSTGGKQRTQQAATVCCFCQGEQLPGDLPGLSHKLMQTSGHVNNNSEHEVIMLMRLMMLLAIVGSLYLVLLEE